MYGRAIPLAVLLDSLMTPERESDSSAVRTPRRLSKKRKGKLSVGQIVGVGVLFVLAAVGMVLLTGRKPQDQPASRSRASRDSTDGTERQRRGRAAPSRVSRRDQKRASRQARRTLRRQTRTREPRTRTPDTRSEPRPRTAASGRTERTGSARTDRPGSSDRAVEAIIESKAGERFALVGSRHLKAGDVVDGRRIVNVESERVQVEHGGRTYSVRIGQNLY